MRSPPLPVSQMATAAEIEIARILSLCTGPPPLGEVATVAHIVLHGAAAIAAAWSPLLAAHGCTFSLNSVFCHQHPQVSFAHTHSPVELADLLLVIDYHFGGQAKRRAALVQAKMDKAGKVRIGSGKAQAQLALFSSWPSFTFHTSGYNSRPRDFSGEVTPSVEDCGRYGAIDLVTVPPFWGQIDPTSANPFVTSLGHSLGGFLAEMADDTAGFGAEATWVAGAPTPTLPDWSFTIAELLHVTYGLVHSAMTLVGSPGGQRGISAIAMAAPIVGLAPRFVAADFGPPRMDPPDTPEPLAIGAPRGLSLIHGVIERA